MKKEVNVELLLELAYADNNEGLCMACGEIAECVEPDARKYECESCGESKVYGAQEALLMFVQMKTRIHVNQHKIRSNAKTGDREPVLTVKTYKTNTYCKTVNIIGPCKVVYSPDNPLPCGAKVWIETEEGVVCD